MSKVSFPQVSTADWRRRVESTHGGSLESLIAHTLAGIDVEPLYAADNSPHPPPRPPAIRAPWRLVQALSGPSPGDVATAIAATRGRGVDGYRLRLDEGLRHAIDPGTAAHRRIGDELGCDGAALHRLADFEAALAEVDLEARELHLDAGAAGLGATAALAALARARGVAPSRLSGSLGADPLAAFAASGRLPCSFGSAARQLAALAAWSAAEAPGLRALLVSARPYHDAGGSAVDELAFSLATAVEYLRWLTDRGLGLDAACGEIVFEHCAGGDLFLEIAKLRAARLLWARVVEAAGGSGEATRMELRVLSSWRELSLLDPRVNAVRATAAAFAAAVGGADSIVVLPFDSAAGNPSATAERLAINTQLILREESRLDRVADPAAGSWALEALTGELARAAWALFQQVEAAGGQAACLEGGRVQQRIQTSCRALRQAVATRAEPLIGVSEYAAPGAPPPEPDGWDGAEAALRELRSARRLEPPPADLVGSPELVGWAAEQVAAGAPLDAVTVVLSAPTPLCAQALAPRRLAEPWEELRRRAAATPEAAALLLPLGGLREHRARTGFARNLLAAGGIEARERVTSDPEEAAAALAETGCRLAVLSASDAAYEERGVAFVQALHRAGARCVAITGKPPNEDELRRAGASIFLHREGRALALLERLLASLETSR